MIIIDSSIWISYFQNNPEKIAEKLEKVLAQDEDVVVLPMVITEVLMGFKNDVDFSSAKKVMSQIPQIPLTEATYIEAAQLYRKLRKKGVTVSGAIDCIIAQVTINLEAQLFTLDKDFKKIAEHTPLQLMK